MHNIIIALLLCGVPAAVIAQQRPRPVVGTWEGESICTVRDSPCHDEHVVYEIKTDAGTRDRLNVDGYKVVNGEKQFMGTLVCTYTAPTLSCTGNTGHDDLWTFTVADHTMTGELRIEKSRILYRKIRVTRRGQ